MNSVINILVLLTWRRTCYLRGADLVTLERLCYTLTSKSRKLSIPTQTNRSPVITSVLKKDQENTSSSTHSPEISHENFITGFLGRFVQELNFFTNKKVETHFNTLHPVPKIFFCFRSQVRETLPKASYLQICQLNRQRSRGHLKHEPD